MSVPKETIRELRLLLKMIPNPEIEFTFNKLEATDYIQMPDGTLEYSLEISRKRYAHRRTYG